MKKLRVVVNDKVSRRIEKAAKTENMSAEEFIIEAIKEKAVQKNSASR